MEKKLIEKKEKFLENQIPRLWTLLSFCIDSVLALQGQEAK